MKKIIIVMFMAIFCLMAFAADEEQAKKTFTVNDLATTDLLSGLPAGEHLLFQYGMGGILTDEENEILARANIRINEGLTLAGQEIKTVSLGYRLDNVGLFMQPRDDDDNYTGSYIGLRAPDASLIARVEISGLAPADDKESKGFIFSAERAFSFMDYGHSRDTSFKISFVDTLGMVVGSLVAKLNDEVNEMSITSGFFNTKTVKTITANEGYITQRSGFLVDVPERAEFFQLAGNQLTILFYDAKMSVFAGGRFETMTLGNGNYQKIDKIIIEVGDETNPGSGKSSLVLLEPRFDQIF